MGLDDMPVVDAFLTIHGIARLRIADESVLPRMTTGNTQVSSAIISERAADVMRRQHGI